MTQKLGTLAALRAGAALVVVLSSASALAHSSGRVVSRHETGKGVQVAENEAQGNQRQAQPAAPPPPSAATQLQPGTDVGAIIVTAQKRAQRLQDVPVSVAAVSPETLRKTAVDNTSGLTALVPGLNLNNAAFGFRPYIRGVGTSASASGNENPVPTYLDNIYLASMTAGLVNLTDIESVEVLKGPQGTLFGRNATGGVINIHTRSPSQTFQGVGDVSFDSYQTLIAKGYVTGGLSKTLAASLSGYFRNQYKGYGVNLLTGNRTNYEDDLTLRGKILFTPTDVDTFLLTGDYSRVNGSGNTYVPVRGSTTNWGPPDATHPLPNGAPYQYTGSLWDLNEPTDPFQRIRTGGGALTYKHEFSWGSISSFTSYRKSSNHIAWNGTPVPTMAQYVNVKIPEKQFTQEFQLSSLPTSKVQWILGAFYINSSSGYDPFVNRLLRAAPNQTQWFATEKTKSPAIYGQVTAPIEALGDTNITMGLRYTIDRRSIVGHIEVVPVASPTTVLATVNPTDASKTFKTPTWRLSIDHHFTKDLMVYASYNRGFKGGSYNTIPPGGPTAQPSQPEYLDAYEAGFKSMWLDHRLSFNVAAFLYSYSNLQVTIFNQSTATIQNAAKAQIKGLDFDLNFNVTPDLHLFASGEFLDHHYTKYPNGPILQLLTLAQGGGVLGSVGDLSGKPLIYTADQVISGGYFYQHETSAGTLDLNGVATWNSGYTVEPSAAIWVRPFWQINASAGWTLANRRTRISVFGKNLANAAYPKSEPTASNPGGYVEANYNPPRTFGVEISQKF